MTGNEVFSLLTQKAGGFSLPYLICLTDGNTALRYVNASEDITYGDETYKSEVFKFSASADALGFFGGGTLEIARTYDVVSLLENSDTVTVRIKGILYNGEVTEIKDFESRHCKATFSKSTVKMELEKDDRLSMTFPATVFTAANNSGNA